MQRIIRGILVLMLNMSLGMANANGQNRPASPAEQYESLRKECDRATNIGIPHTDAERLKFIGLGFRARQAFAHRFVELAKKYPDDPIALDALIQAVWQVNTIPWPVELVGEDTARAEAFEILQRDHIQSDRLGPLCERVSYGFCKEYESFLRTVLAKNPHKRVQAAASLSLAQFLYNRLQRLDLVRNELEQAKEFAGLYGKEYLAELQRQQSGDVLREVEALFEQTAKKYGDVNLPAGGTAAERATAQLVAIRTLRVGKAAPDIEGMDQDGKPFKLSDYRGKVVLLDFWSYV